MNILIRNARPCDCTAISDIIKQSLGYENPPETIKLSLERLTDMPSEKILIAESDGKAVGFIHCENYNSLYSPPLKEVMSFAVHPDWQKKGIGTLLLKEIEKWAADTGRCGLMVFSREDRIRAHNFYVNYGFETDKTQINLKKYF